jgi:quinol monooxygenase YgiN
MNKTGLFIKHQANPGMRDDVQRVWEKHVKPRAAANPGHLAYYFCHDNSNPDVICVFQLYASEAAMKEFLSGSWYSEYLVEIAPFIAAGPQIVPATLVWSKESSASL